MPPIRTNQLEASLDSPSTTTSSSRGRNKPSSEPYIPRPPNSFFIFRSEALEKYKLRKVDRNQCNLSRIVSHLWRNLSDTEKAHYSQAAEIKRMEHRLEHPDYVFRPRKRGDSQVKQRRKARVNTTNDVTEIGTPENVGHCSSETSSPPSSPSSSVSWNDLPPPYMLIPSPNSPGTAPSSSPSASSYSPPFPPSQILNQSQTQYQSVAAPIPLLPLSLTSWSPACIRNEALTEAQLIQLMERFNH